MFVVVRGSRIHPLGVFSGFHTNQNSDFVLGNNSKCKMILIENAQYRSLFSVKAATQDPEQVRLPSRILFQCVGLLS